MITVADLLSLLNPNNCSEYFEYFVENYILHNIFKIPATFELKGGDRSATIS
jgi:hypothetical protein